MNDISNVPENLNVSILKDKKVATELSLGIITYSEMIKQIVPEVIISEIDYSKAFISSEKNEKGEGIGVNIKITENKTVTFMLCKNADKIGIPKLIVIDNRFNIKYYDLTSNASLQLTIQNNKLTKTVSGKMTNLIQSRVEDCGQATQDCITDAYSSHGWTSVWLTLQSAFLPQTAVAIAAACAAKNCLN